MPRKGNFVTAKLQQAGHDALQSAKRGWCLACRIASVEAQTRLICLTLRREVFVEILGPLEQLMTREKSPQVITQRLLKLQTKGTPTHMPAEVCSQHSHTQHSDRPHLFRDASGRPVFQTVLQCCDSG